MGKAALRVAVVGAGDMGLRHLKGWASLEGVEVVALVDDVPARLEEAGASLLKTPALYTDYRQAIEEARPDVVSVCVPTAFHGPVALYAIERGAHVLCEKPIALSLEEADAMLEAAERKGVLLAVGFMLRYTAAIVRLKEWVSSGAIGKPILYTSENFMEVRPKVLMHAKKVNGGPLLDYWCHHFDLWSYLFQSEPVSIAGYGTIFAQGKTEVEHLDELAVDTASLSIRYKSGDIAQLATTWGLPRSLASFGFSSDRLIGPEGLIFGDIRQQLTLVNGAGRSEEISNSGLDWWATEIEAFARTIREGGKPLVGAAQGRKALQLSLAALEAIESGRTVIF